MLSTMLSVSGRAGFPERRGCWGGGLPVGRQQDVPVGHGGQALQNFGEPGFGIVAVAFGASALSWEAKSPSRFCRRCTFSHRSDLWLGQ